MKRKKDVHESNQLVRWGILSAIFWMVILGFIALSVDVSFVRDRAFIPDHYIRAVLLLLFLFLVLLGARRMNQRLAKQLNSTYLQRFQHIPELGTFKEAESRMFSATRPIKHAVLLLHGFTASPQEFNCLIPGLEALNIPYYAPDLIGFGLDNTDILKNIRYQDWFRKAMEAYDVLAAFSERVSIVGHSMGGILAIFVAQHRSVEHLILSSPGVYSVANDLKYKRILSTPLLAQFYSWCIPYLPKPIRKGRPSVCDMLDQSSASQTFQYLAIPVRAVAEVFKAQDQVDITQVNARDITLLYGAQDMTVNNARMIQALDSHRVPVQVHCLENTAHNAFEDFDRKEACDIALEVLQKRGPF